MQYTITMKRCSVLLALLALAGCQKQEAPPAAAAPAVEVGVVLVQSKQVMMTAQLSGRTNPYVVAEVRPQVGGIILQRAFKEGSDVKRGDLLYQIDPAPFQATYDSAKATLAKAEANLATAKARASRYADLVKINAVSRQDYDDADASYKQGQADVASSQAALENARINLNYTKVMSPISGRIGKSDVTQGALVTANQANALTKVQQLDPIYVDVTQSSAEWLRLQQQIESGQLKVDGKNQAKVKLQLEDGTPYSQEGKLEFSDVSVDQTTGTITVRALFPNPKKLLLPGMYVRAVLDQGVNEEALMVPQAAVSRNAKGQPTVIVITPDNKVDRRTIEVGSDYQGQWLVTSGLKAGEQVVVEGAQRLQQPNVEVKAVPVSQTKSDKPAGAGSAPAAETKGSASPEKSEQPSAPAAK